MSPERTLSLGSRNEEEWMELTRIWIWNFASNKYELKLAPGNKFLFPSFSVLFCSFSPSRDFYCNLGRKWSKLPWLLLSWKKGRIFKNFEHSFLLPSIQYTFFHDKISERTEQNRTDRRYISYSSRAWKWELQRKRGNLFLENNPFGIRDQFYREWKKEQIYLSNAFHGLPFGH